MSTQGTWIVLLGATQLVKRCPRSLEIKFQPLFLWILSSGYIQIYELKEQIVFSEKTIIRLFEQT